MAFRNWRDCRIRLLAAGRGKSRLTGNGFDTCPMVPGMTPRNAHHFSFEIELAPVSIYVPKRLWNVLMSPLVFGSGCRLR